MVGNQTIYLFWAKSNNTNLASLDVYVFVKYLRDQEKVLTNTKSRLVAVKVGFQYQYGRGKFIIDALNCTSMVNPPPTAIPTIVVTPPTPPPAPSPTPAPPAPPPTPAHR